MNIDALFRHKAFESLEYGQLQLIKQFATDARGKGGMEIARMYTQLNQKINQIKPISTAQRSAIIDAIREYLPEGDQHKLNRFIKMIGR